jgi:hypothetical protein
MAEWLALASLTDQVKGKILPLIEFPPSQFIPPNSSQQINVPERIHKLVNELEKYWPDRRFFLDMQLLSNMDPSGEFACKTLEQTWLSCRSTKLVPIPVTSVDRSPNYQAVVMRCISNIGSLCVRINTTEINSGIGNSLVQFLKPFNLPIENVHIVIDYSYITECTVPFQKIYSALQSKNDWGSITICAGSFPLDLSRIPIGNHEIPRLEWQAWQSQFKRNNKKDVPLFGDYTIQHPLYKEPVKGCNPSASLRYTLDTTWMIMRGEGLRKSPLGNNQYVGHAQLLTEEDYFYGTTFSSGDQYISKIAEGNEGKTGNPRTWLQAGINHHMTVVVHQVENAAGV